MANELGRRVRRTIVRFGRAVTLHRKIHLFKSVQISDSNQSTSITFVGDRYIVYVRGTSGGVRTAVKFIAERSFDENTCFSIINFNNDGHGHASHFNFDQIIPIYYCFVGTKLIKCSLLSTSIGRTSGRRKFINRQLDHTWTGSLFILFLSLSQHWNGIQADAVAFIWCRMNLWTAINSNISPSAALCVCVWLVWLLTRSESINGQWQQRTSTITKIDYSFLKRVRNSSD